jgi:polygalacturonase
MNPNNETIPDSRMRPKLIEFYNSTNIILDRFMARNSPVWFIHPFLSKNISMTNLTLLAPRSIGNTDGLDPDSCENVLMDSCYIDVGDDGVSIKVRRGFGRKDGTKKKTETEQQSSNITISQTNRI